MVNPFNPKYPIKPEFFANRNKEIERFKRDLKRTADSKLPENIAILGDWGVGKSSLAYKFMDIAVNSGINTLSTGFSVPRTIKNVDEFCYLLLYKLNQDLMTSMKVSSKVKEGLALWKMKRLKLGPLSVERSKEVTKIPITQLHSSLIELWEGFLSKEGIEVVVVVIDDMHHLINAVKGGILDIRSVFQDLPRYDCNYQLIITGHSGLFGDIRELAEPMGRFFNTYEINEFTRDETEELITTPINAAELDIIVANEAVDTLYNKTKGNPYFISFFMQTLVEERKKGAINTAFIQGRIDRILSELEREKFEIDLAIASDYERKVLKRMASKEEVVRLKDLHSQTGKSTVARALNRLVEKNLVIKVERGKYKLYHPLFKEFLRRAI